MDSVTSIECPPFDLVCPQCKGHCYGVTSVSGTRGTYREVYVKYGVERISCGDCGYIKDLDPGEPQQLKLWYHFEVLGGSVWAHNRERLLALKKFLERSASPVDSGFEALPKWMLTKKARPLIVSKIEHALARETNNGEQADALNPGSGLLLK